MGAKVEPSHGDARRDQSDQGPRDAGADARRDQRHDQDPSAQSERIGIGLPEPAQDVDEAREQMPLLPRNA